MKIVVFGATGRLGRCLVEQALQKNNLVTAAVRSPQKMMAGRERVTIIPCSVMDPASVTRAVEGQDAVIVALGTGPARATTLYSVSARNIVRAMEDRGVRRLLLVSNYAVTGERAPDPAGQIMLFLTRLYLRRILPDQRQAVEEVRQSHLEWIVVRPLALTNGPRTGRYRVAMDGLPVRGKTISRADVADFILNQLSASDYVRTIPAISY